MNLTSCYSLPASQDPLIPMIGNLRYDHKTNEKSVAIFSVPKKLGPSLRDFSMFQLQAA